VIFEIVIHPDSRLRKISKPVTEIDEQFKQFLKDFTETMYERDGVGLAAVQVGVLKRVIVIDVSEPKTKEDRKPVIYINPRIVDFGGEIEVEEGCLSVPKIYEPVKRYEWVKVIAQDINLQEFEVEAKDVLAIALQHEIDHLDGKLFIDKISPLKYQRITSKMEKYKKNLEKQKEKAKEAQKE